RLQWPAPENPFLRESVEPRTGHHPRTGEALSPSDSTEPMVNSINGHERAAVAGTDHLQSTCLFPLSEPTVCSDSPGCPCTDQAVLENDPRCQPPGGGPAGRTQYFADAKPSLRQLGLLHQMSEDAVVASACPKRSPGEGSDAHAGYRPAIEALLLQLAEN